MQLSSSDQELLAAIKQSDHHNAVVQKVQVFCTSWITGNGATHDSRTLTDLLYDIVQLPPEKKVICETAILGAGVFKNRIALQKRLKTINPTSEGPETKTKPIYCARFHGLVDLVEDAGRVRYLIRQPNGGLEVTDSIERDGKKFVPPPMAQIPYMLAKVDNVKNAYLRDDPGALFSDLVQYHQRISLLPSEDHLILLAAWDFSTYRQEVLPYSGYLAFFNVAERGKTRTGKGLMSVAFRGVHTVTVREANLFRLSQDLQASIFLDVMDLSRKLEKHDSEDILLQRFEKGAKVLRTLYPDKGAFEDTVSFDIFGPTVIATNVALHKILDTRCFPISMPHTSKHYPAPSSAEGLNLRERLLAWRAKRIFEPLADSEKIMSGRLGDIAMPLRSILQEVKPEAVPAYDNLIDQMQESSREDKSQSLEARVMRIVKTISLAKFGGGIPISEIAAKLNQGIEEDSKAYVNPWKIGRIVKALGFKRGRSSTNRFIEVEAECLDAMCQEYGIEDSSENFLETSQASQGHTLTDGPSDISGDNMGSQMSLPSPDEGLTL